MKTSRFTDSQIIAILKQAEAGTHLSSTPKEGQRRTIELW